MSPLRAPDWPRCDRCQKPSAPAYRVEHEGKTYCSPSCVESLVEEVSMSILRRQVLDRDRGICSECGEDCLRLRAEIDELGLEVKRLENLSGNKNAENHFQSLRRHEVRVHQLARLGFDKHAVESGASLWELDHVEPRVKGGRNTLENARTLCLACHKKATGELASSRAASRKSRGRFGR